MKTIYCVFVVAFAMENFCASAQQYTVSACKNGTLLLECRTGLIQIDGVVLGDSTCSGSNCCPHEDDCNGPPTLNYRNQVQTTCNGQPSCSMSVEIRNIGCSFWGPNNDYATITYSCIATQTSPEPTILIAPIPTTDQSSVDGSTKLNPGQSQKPGESTSGSEQGKSASQVKEDKDHGYLDRVTTLVAVIVGGVIITAIVISVTVVLVLKKRSVAKIEEEHYEMPNYSCNANSDDENVRNSNIYEVIPDSGNCSEHESAAIVDCTAKENDYLTPVMEREEAPYLWIP